MPQSSIEEMLRQEYLDLLPEIQSVASALEAEIREQLHGILAGLRSHEQILIKSRIKKCDSAVKTLRGKSDGRVFDPDRAGEYSIKKLPDLVVVRILVFPGANQAG